MGEIRALAMVVAAMAKKKAVAAALVGGAWAEGTALVALAEDKVEA